MKKTLTALFALSGTLIFAYITKPSINLPILRARLGQSAQSRGGKGANLLPVPTSEEFQQPLPFPKNSQVSANKAWHDAIASDVLRQIMVRSAVARSAINSSPPEKKRWKILNEDSSLGGPASNATPRTVKKRARLSGPGENRAGNIENSAKTRALKSSHSRFITLNSRETLARAKKQRRQKFPKLSGEKRLLIDWVRSGKVPGEKRVASTKAPSRQPSQNKHRSNAQSDPLAKAFRLARKKARISSRQLKTARRKAARTKIVRKKNEETKRSISKLLGAKAIHAPRTKVSPPPNPWDNKALPPMPKGEPMPSGSLSLTDAEQLPPPPKGTSKSGKAWLSNGTETYYHDGSRWGVLANGRWGWIVSAHGKSFLYPSPDSKPLLQSKGYLWVQDQGALLIYHNGQALGGDELSQWKQDHADVKPNIRYSPDLKRMAIGSTVFDLETGEKL